MEPSGDKLGHILLEPYCILCRNHAQFARETVTKPENPEAPEPWEKVVMCCAYIQVIILSVSVRYIK